MVVSRALLVASLALTVAGCRDVLGVPVPAGVVNPSDLNTPQGVEAKREGAIAALANAVDVEFSGLFADEFTDYFAQAVSGFEKQSEIDARNVGSSTTTGEPPGTYIFTDFVYAHMQVARINAELAASAASRLPSAAAQGTPGEMLAIAGYAELMLSEEFCSGLPLGTVIPGGGFSNGVPLTTDSLIGKAIADFDSALAHAASNDTVLNLARIGLGRALLDRGRSHDAAAAVAQVPVGFVYTTALPAGFLHGNLDPNFYAELATPGSYLGPLVTVSDREGGNGLDFVSARDPRMPIDSSLGPTISGTPFYYPAKFPIGGAPPIPLADWIEARLIVAEGALADGDVATWAQTLNALRSDSSDTHVGGLPPLTSDSTSTASAAMRLDVLFRERAFWMFGTGHRLGDLRRLIRLYGRDPESVFPTGAYPATGLPVSSSVIPAYGTDVNIPIKAAEQANPNFHGCLSHGA